MDVKPLQQADRTTDVAFRTVLVSEQSSIIRFETTA